MLVVIDEFFLYSSVKSLIMGIHFRCSRVCMIVDLVEIAEMLVKMLLEFTSVVSEYEMDLERKELLECFKEFFCSD